MGGASTPAAGDMLDVKPLRTLSPLLPPSLGPFSFQTPPFIFFPHSDKPEKPGKPEKPEKPSTPAKRKKPSKPIIKPSKPSKPISSAVATAAPEDPAEAVEGVLQTFDAIRRRLLQLDAVSGGNCRAEMKAGAAMSRFNLRANAAKRAGPVPGVAVGDIFFFRMEILLVGLHQQSMAGIDFLPDAPAALSVVASCGGGVGGGYDDDTASADALVYSGQGSGGDQKLERGNLALERSCRDGADVRVIRGVKLPGGATKLYIYDGLYRVSEYWTETAKSGFSVFKFRLLRSPGQPAAFDVWKAAELWRRDGAAARGPAVRSPDLAAGAEAFPVVLVNEVDAAPDPAPFIYASGRAIQLNSAVAVATATAVVAAVAGCRCQRNCTAGDEGCDCRRKNGGVPPYVGGGRLVRRQAVVYECGPGCRCSESCQLRATQTAPKLHFEVFKTVDRGWGLRSWDPIRRGDFVCEFVGDELAEDGANCGGGGGGGGDGDDDGFVFEGRSWGEGVEEWNYGPELVGEAPPEEEKAEAMVAAVSAKQRGNVARFMNHSCRPNLFWQAVVRAGEEGRRQCHVMFFARRHIPPMAELTYDYGAAAWGRGKESKCACGEPNCRGIFYKR
ncbi:histone-lysine N-methyltransferase, H3 lysine-9 specific SUVH3-like [Wolffia australiana]